MEVSKNLQETITVEDKEESHSEEGEENQFVSDGEAESSEYSREAEEESNSED